MLINGLYCPNNNQCYFATRNQLDKLSDEAELDIYVVDCDDRKTNLILNKQKDCLFSSENPLKLVDFLNGYIACKKNINNEN